VGPASRRAAGHAALVAALLAGCGYSEGGTEVVVRAVVAASDAACPWRRASATLAGLALEDAATSGGLTAAWAPRHSGPDAAVMRLPLVHSATTTIELIRLAPAPGAYAALILTLGSDYDRGWPALSGTSSTGEVRALDVELPARLPLGDVVLAEDAHATLDITGWTCPPAAEPPPLERLRATWRPD
jgi:hypothetical protein